MTTKKDTPFHPTISRVGDVEHAEGGVTLRDWFAGQFLAGIAPHVEEALDQAGAQNVAEICRRAAAVAYGIADAMMARREK